MLNTKLNRFMLCTLASLLLIAPLEARITTLPRRTSNLCTKLLRMGWGVVKTASGLLLFVVPAGTIVGAGYAVDGLESNNPHKFVEENLSQVPQVCYQFHHKMQALADIIPADFSCLKDFMTEQTKSIEEECVCVDGIYANLISHGCGMNCTDTKQCDSMKFAQWSDRAKVAIFCSSIFGMLAIFPAAVCVADGLQDLGNELFGTDEQAPQQNQAQVQNSN